MLIVFLSELLVLACAFVCFKLRMLCLYTIFEVAKVLYDRLLSSNMRCIESNDGIMDLIFLLALASRRVGLAAGAGVSRGATTRVVVRAAIVIRVVVATIRVGICVQRSKGASNKVS